MSILKSYLKPYSAPLILGGILILASSLLLLPTPLLTRQILDQSIPSGNSTELFALIALAFGILLFQRTIGYVQGMLFYKVNNRIVFDIRFALLKKIGRTQIGVLKQYGNGYLMSRINSDTESLRSLFADTMVNILKDSLTLIVGLIAIFFLHVKLALIVLCLLPFYITAMLYFSKKVKAISKIYYEDLAQSGKALDENLSGLELVRLFSRPYYNLLRYVKKSAVAYRSGIKSGRISYFNGLILGLIGGLAPLIIVGCGGYEIINQRLTIGSLIAFNSFVGYVFGPVNSLVNVNVAIQRAVVALDRIKEIFALPEESQLGIRNEKLGIVGAVPCACPDLAADERKLTQIDILPRPVQGEGRGEGSPLSITFNNITFGYKPNQPFLKNISFSAQAGQKIGIVGSSGGGKSTILKILTGLYTADSGSLLFNESELDQTGIIALRKHIAVVEQEPFLFNDSIYNNIAFGRAGATESAILAAAKLAHVDEFVKNLPDSYQTQTGIKGNSLSVGQKQRIALARALLKQPKILILDEATSAIDPISEEFIKTTIAELPQDMIVFIVAHRLTTIRECDKILVLDQGKILESGSHEELMLHGGLYQKMNGSNLYA